MEIRHTTMDDLDEVMKIFDIARETMRRSGNMNQWIKGYPSRSLITADIESNNSYVVTENGEIIAALAFIVGEDPSYREIDGAWLNDEAYGVIHRIGTNGKVKGVIPFVVDYAFTRVSNIRIDTHADNRIMQHVLEKNGFVRCGTIIIEDGTERVAFQKVK